MSPGSGGGHALDTSVAVAALDGGHAAHRSAADAVRRHRPALAGHAAFETFSVLTRLPGRMAIAPTVASRAIGLAFPERLWLDPDQCEALFRRLDTAGIVGGMVYDALVGEAARVHDSVLLTRDHRALTTYDLLGVRHQIVDS